MFPFLFRAKGRGNRSDLKRKTSRNHPSNKGVGGLPGRVILHDISPYLMGEELKVEDLLVILIKTKINEPIGSRQIVRVKLLYVEVREWIKKQYLTMCRVF
ncbi:hypothetical protein SRABI133_02246 [Peribacillus simplex]|uniref:Uncharacterized protein n=1 Tax=Peribacillus simplex TaxID=1478 RepID=A0A9W4PEZ0_9BACI|nr:hypothetical protein SRABI133_02246 [Peribacillus simplex]